MSFDQRVPLDKTTKLAHTPTGTPRKSQTEHRHTRESFQVHSDRDRQRSAVLCHALGTLHIDANEGFRILQCAFNSQVRS